MHGGAGGASGAVVQLCLQPRTPALPPYHPPCCLENRGFQGSGLWEAAGLCVDRLRGHERDNWKGEREPGTAVLAVGTDLLHQPNVLFQTLCCSLAKRMLLLMSSCSSSCSPAINQNPLFMKPFLTNAHCCLIYVLCLHIL